MAIYMIHFFKYTHLQRVKTLRPALGCGRHDNRKEQTSKCHHKLGGSSLHHVASGSLHRVSQRCYFSCGIKHRFGSPERVVPTTARPLPTPAHGKIGTDELTIKDTYIAIPSRHFRSAIFLRKLKNRQAKRETQASLSFFPPLRPSSLALLGTFDHRLLSFPTLSLLFDSNFKKPKQRCTVVSSLGDKHLTPAYLTLVSAALRH